jgi:uncharacterized protein (TIGR00375 family)
MPQSGCLMEFAADLHVHSYYSRATSRQMNLEQLHYWAQLKGLRVVGTGDFTHPAWRAELRQKLEPAEPGLFRLKPEYRDKAGIIPQACRALVRFMLSAEVSCIYKKSGRTRKVHSLILAPDFGAAGAISAALNPAGRLDADGRPIVALDCKRLLQLTLDVCADAALIPAHIWTPHCAVLGSGAGFDSLEECFEEMTPAVFAVETGLSSDPPMNWELSQLDRFTLISNSDAHSPAKLAREATLFVCPLSYEAMLRALKTRDPEMFAGTLEMNPAEGKYYYDGHRACSICLAPEETLSAGGLCPQCGRRVTIGVLHRVRQLADRQPGARPQAAPDFESLIPLIEVIAAIRGVGVSSQKVAREYGRLLDLLGNELNILRKCPIEDLQQAAGETLAEVLGSIRARRITMLPGYDGCYGRLLLQ